MKTMTESVQFDCPQCGRVCGFKACHIGRRARCTRCNTLFIIPTAGQRAVIVKPPVLDEGLFLGFWAALLKDTPKALLHPHSLAGIGAMAVFSLLRYYLGHPHNALIIVAILIPFGILISLPATLFQAWYLMAIIQETSDHEDALPLFVGKGWVDRFFESFFYVYALAVLVVASLLPAWGIWAAMPQTDHIPLGTLLLAGCGLFFLPGMLTVFATTHSLLLCFRLDYILGAALKTKGPYLTLYIMTLAIAALLWQSALYLRNAPTELLARSPAFHIAATALAVLAARAAGLFARHYGGRLP